MKTMKRFLAATMAVTSVMALAPMSAFADTTNVTFDAPRNSPEYMITIPATADLNAETPTATIKAENVYLDTTKHKQINVTLDSAQYVETGASEFIAKTEDGSSSVTYTIGKGDATTGVKVGDTVAEFTADGSQVLSFSEPTGATYAGTHTEKLTFGIAVEEAVTTKTLTLSGRYFNGNTGTFVTKSLEIEYTDNDTWKDIAERYDEVSLLDNRYGPEGKVVMFWCDMSQGIMGCELKSNESTYRYNLVSINDKVSAYSSYFLNDG